MLSSDPLWARLNDTERRQVMAWECIARRMVQAPDKRLEVQRIVADYQGVLKGVSRSAIYRKVRAVATGALASVLDKGTLRRLGQRASGALPPAFVVAWRQRCAGHQRDKVLPVWHTLMMDLINGRLMPGYESDWRGIWLAEHPGERLPLACPYRADHRAGKHPTGWSYRNLKMLAPERDVQAACSQGASALRRFLPSVPHSRVGLGVMRCITMDDVWHDVEVLFLHGAQMPTHERPVEVGVLDVLTGCHVAWQVWPVLRREDGSRQMVDWTVQRFIQATLFCGIGVHPDGLIELLEHGTAGLSDEEVARIDGILCRYLPPPASGHWLTVERSSTTGAPLQKGLFVERACGNPRHKAMLESSWNLLHNALAALPGQVGKDRDHAPHDKEGLERADRALMQAVNAVAKQCPHALDILRQAEFHAVSFLKFKEALTAVKQQINHRTDHTLQDWEACGFVSHEAELPGGAVLDLEAVPPAQLEATSALIKQLNAPVRLRRLSPAEAFQKACAETRLVRFPVACAMEILGEDLSETLDVTQRGELKVRDRFSREVLHYSAVAQTVEGTHVELRRGATYRVWANPFERTVLLVADLQGRAVGICPLLQATTWGDTEGVKQNLGLWQTAAAKQRERLEPLLEPKKARKRATEAQVEAVVEAAQAHQEAVESARIESLADWAALTAPVEPREDEEAVQLEDFLN